MTPDEIAQRIADIHANHSSYTAGGKFTALRREVLQAIADGADNPRELAAAALRTSRQHAPKRQSVTPAAKRSLICAHRGWSIKHEAETWRIQPETVRQHRRSALRALNASSFSHAIQILMARGELTEDDLALYTPDQCT